MRPVIGIATCRRAGDYVESVRRAGGDPLVLEIAARPAASVVELVDGLLLTGGGDVDPSRFGQARHASIEDPEPGRDDYELALVEAAVAAGRPLLGICRGLQVLNVARGGSLIQDIPSQRPGSLIHTVPSPRDAIAHVVRIVPQTRLAEALGSRVTADESVPVNSRHHQAVDRVAPGFEVCAVAPDGVIEALERPDAPFLVGVQWHPENFWRTGEFDPLFSAFLKACAAR